MVGAIIIVLLVLVAVFYYCGCCVKKNPMYKGVPVATVFVGDEQVAEVRG